MLGEEIQRKTLKKLNESEWGEKDGDRDREGELEHLTTNHADYVWKVLVVFW